MASSADPVIATLAIREAWRDGYRGRRDPIAAERLLWRAQAFRHLVHLLPGQSVLELGCGDLSFTRVLARVSRGENPITAVSFRRDVPVADDLPPTVERLALGSLPGPLAEHRFDFIVGIDLLDRRNSARLLEIAYDLLAPGGRILLFESNPWNLVLRLRNLVARLLGRRPDPRTLLNRPQLYELLSEVGFIRVFAIYNDFVYAPLTRQLIWLLRNLSIILENTPGVRTLAGSILVHAQKPPRLPPRPRVSLAGREELRGAVSVVIPCHNEAMNIGPLVQGLLDLYEAYIHEIIPVDDNSRDGTAAVLRGLAERDSRIRPVFRRPPNGVGRAIADGLRAAGGRWIMSMDCDFQHLLPELRDLFDAAADGGDVIVGSRFSRSSLLLNYPLAKIVANRAFHVLAQLLLRRRFRDLTNNLKLMRREVVEQLELREPGFAVNAETGLQPLVLGYELVEVPISWIDRTFDMGTSSFRLVRVGGGYRRVLWQLLRRQVFNAGTYATLGSPRPPAGKDVTSASL